MSPEQREKMVVAVTVAICRMWGHRDGDAVVPPAVNRYARRLAEAAVDALGLEPAALIVPGARPYSWKDGMDTRGRFVDDMWMRPGNFVAFRVGVLGDTEKETQE